MTTKHQILDVIYDGMHAVIEGADQFIEWLAEKDPEDCVPLRKFCEAIDRFVDDE